MSIRNQFNIIKDLITNTDAIALFAGAGMGVDSGLEQYRSTDGTWTKHIEHAGQKIKLIDLMTHAAFEEQPTLAWSFIQSQIKKYSTTEPHIGFSLLLDLIKEKDYFVITSNIDAHFQKAGYDPLKIYECHGSIFNMQCLDILERDIFPTPFNEPIPKCPKCGGNCRPNVMLFGDWLWIPENSIRQQLRYIEWQKKNKNKTILIIEIGAGKTIATIRKQAESLAESKHTLIRVNPKDFEVTKPNYIGFEMGALEWIEIINFYFKTS